MSLIKSLLFISAFAMVLLYVKCENEEPSKVLGKNLLVPKEREVSLLKRLTRSPSPCFAAPRVDNVGEQGCGWRPSYSDRNPPVYRSPSFRSGSTYSDNYRPKPSHSQDYNRNLDIYN